MVLKEYEIRGMSTSLDLRDELPKVRYTNSLQDQGDFEELLTYNAGYIMSTIINPDGKLKAYFAEGFRHETLRGIIEDIEGRRLDDQVWHPGQLGIDVDTDKIGIVKFHFTFGNDRVEVESVVRFLLDQINPTLLREPFVRVKLSDKEFYRYFPALKRLAPQAAVKTYLREKERT